MNPSMARMNRDGDRGSLCLRPLEALKLPLRDPYRLIEKDVVDMQMEIQHLNCLGKFMFVKIDIR